MCFNIKHYLLICCLFYCGHKNSISYYLQCMMGYMNAQYEDMDSSIKWRGPYLVHYLGGTGAG